MQAERGARGGRGRRPGRGRPTGDRDRERAGAPAAVARGGGGDGGGRRGRGRGFRGSRGGRGGGGPRGGRREPRGWGAGASAPVRGNSWWDPGRGRGRGLVGPGLVWVQAQWGSGPRVRSRERRAGNARAGRRQRLRRAGGGRRGRALGCTRGVGGGCASLPPSLLGCAEVQGHGLPPPAQEVLAQLLKNPAAAAVSASQGGRLGSGAGVSVINPFGVGTTRAWSPSAKPHRETFLLLRREGFGGQFCSLPVQCVAHSRHIINVYSVKE